MSKKSWMFQANPKIYPAEKVLIEGAELNWRVNRFDKEIQIGDEGYFWVAGKSAGIYAVAEVITDPQLMQKDEFEKAAGFNSEQILKEASRVRIRINQILSPFIAKEYLKTHAILKNLMVITNPRGAGSISRIKPEQEQYIQKLLSEY